MEIFIFKDGGLNLVGVCRWGDRALSGEKR